MVDWLFCSGNGKITIHRQILKGIGMYSVYSVQIVEGEKLRTFVLSTPNESMAKHAANVATCNGADYAYVKSFGDGTIFFIRRPDYSEGPPDLARLRPQSLPSSQV